MFAERLKKLRTEKGLNQTELAKILNVAKQTISNWELGNRTPDDKMLIKIADLFNVSTDYLLCRTDNPNFSIVEGTLNGKPFKATVESKDINIDGVELSMDEFDTFIKLLKQSFVNVKSVAEASKNK